MSTLEHVVTLLRSEATPAKYTTRTSRGRESYCYTDLIGQSV
jgi:hypothetical protein